MKKFKGFLRGLGMLLVVVVGVAAWLALPWFVLLALAVLFAVWMALTRRGRQAGSVTQVGLSTLRQRIGASSVVVIGIAGVVGVLVAMLAMAEGYRETLRKSGSEDTAIVMRGASAAGVMSTLDHASVTVIQQAPGIARDAQGRPLASPRQPRPSQVLIRRVSSNQLPRSASTSRIFQTQPGGTRRNAAMKMECLHPHRSLARSGFGAEPDPS